MQIVLISTYDLGHQPFGLASPAAWLQKTGVSVKCLDLSLDGLDEIVIQAADLIAIYLPMHTATRLASELMPRLKLLNDNAHYCCFGLYAPLNESFLRNLGVQTILGGEFETGLVSLSNRLQTPHYKLPEENQSEPLISHDKQYFITPERRDFPHLSQYAHLDIGNGISRIVGYTEASRGCKHLCRHCPVVPVYQGKFRIVQPDIVLNDIRQQVISGAQHICFGDPDFFNGVGHAKRVIETFHNEFPDITYDVTIKIEHLLKYQDQLSMLAKTGCLFVTTAVESVEDRILNLLDKGHSRDEFIRAVMLCRQAGITLSPTFIPFTPWTTQEDYLNLLDLIVQLDLVDYVAPIQLAIRLLVPKGSLLLEKSEMRMHLGPYDESSLSYPWCHRDPEVDELHEHVLQIVQKGEANGLDRRAIFNQIWQTAEKACHKSPSVLSFESLPDNFVPRMSEPWYCCAEPTEDQLARL